LLEWRASYVDEIEGRRHRIRIDIPHLKEPLQYDMNILPKDEFMPYMHKHLQFIKDNRNENDRSKFSDLEYEKFSRVVQYMETTEYPEWKLQEGRRDFYNWFTEYDNRRGTNFKETFPELVSFFNECKKLVDE